jgi:hypothetical protein
MSPLRWVRFVNHTLFARLLHGLSGTGVSVNSLKLTYVHNYVTVNLLINPRRKILIQLSK